MVVQARANANLTQKNIALADANDREVQRFNLALDAAQYYHGEVSQDLILKEELFKPLRTKLLRGATDFYGKLEAQSGDNDSPASQAALARSYRQLGGLHSTLGNRTEASAAHHKSLAIQRRLAALPGAEPDMKLEVASTLLSLGWVHLEL